MTYFLPFDVNTGGVIGYCVDKNRKKKKIENLQGVQNTSTPNKLDV